MSAVEPLPAPIGSVRSNERGGWAVAGYVALAGLVNIMRHRSQGYHPALTYLALAGLSVVANQPKLMTWMHVANLGKESSTTH